MHRWIPLAVFVLALAGCSGGSGSGAPSPSLTAGEDPHSWSRPEQVRVTELDLDLTVDFGASSLIGAATWTLERSDPAAPLWLDVRHMTIESVVDGNGAPLEHEEGSEEDWVGRALRIDLADDTDRVTIRYRTAPEAGALQWLTPEQTTDGLAPFLLTQSQAIQARTWVPCQDTPAVRFPYEAVIRTDAGLLAVMSAENPTEPAPDGVHRFRMPQPIPSYLLALAVGEIAFLPIGERTGVYAEPSVVEAAAWEFAETEAMLEAVESLYGPYRWGRYDMIVLPASFPFGGMENPRLTFLTPTVLAGDRSLVALIAHELAHSWSGNLVTNATWNDFWLNEGFTDYVEHRIMEAVYGADRAESLATLSRRRLVRYLDEIGHDHPDGHLKLSLAGRDPDEGMSAVAYVKGMFFLRALEEAVGRDAWDPFLQGWFESGAFESRTSESFVDYLEAKLLADHPEARAVGVDGWVYGPGLPDDAPVPDGSALARVDDELEAWREGAAAATLRTEAWTTTEWRYFLDRLQDPIPVERLQDLDAAFAFTETGNSEILSAWLQHAIHGGYEAAIPRARRFLTEQGRMKFLRPLYTALIETGREALAREIYDEARGGYHPLAHVEIERVFATKTPAS